MITKGLILVAALTAIVSPGFASSKCPPKLIERFATPKAEQVARQIAAQKDPSALPQLEPWLTSDDRLHKNAAAFVFASFGDQRGFDIIMARITNLI